MGLVQIAASDYLQEADDGGYEIHDTKSVLSEGLRMGGAGEAKGTIQYTVSFFPALNVADPEEEEEEQKSQSALQGGEGAAATPGDSKKPSLDVRTSVEVPTRQSASMDGRKSLEKAGRLSGIPNGASSINSSINSGRKQAPKVKITAEDVSKYGKPPVSGLVHY